MLSQYVKTLKLMEETMELNSLAIRVARTPGLGMLPQITNQVLKLVDNPHVSPKQVSALIERDAGLATKLLRVANSAYFGTNGKVGTLSQAINTLGLNTVRSLAVSQAYQQMISTRGGASRFDKTAFWQHCLAVATAARILARMKGWRDPEEAFMAGLIHDAGRMIFDRFLPAEFDRALSMAIEEGCTLQEAERYELNYTHTEAGGLLACQWGLPGTIQAVIEKHHDEPVLFEEEPLVCLIYTANVLAHQVGYGIGATVLYEMNPQVQESLGLPVEQYEGVKQLVVQEVVRTQEILRL
jgi:putative nucleotidyltransferase with HDIG domain